MRPRLHENLPSEVRVNQIFCWSPIASVAGLLGMKFCMYMFELSPHPIVELFWLFCAILFGITGIVGLLVLSAVPSYTVYVAQQKKP